MTQSEKPYWSRSGLWLGMRMALPILPGMLAFGIVVGTVAAQKGFSFIESAAMNLFVYAGVSQLVAMEIWPQVVTWPAIAVMAAVVAVVNARFFLMSASLQPWLGALPAWQIYPSLYFLVDPGWLIAMRYRADGGNDAAVYGGSTLLMVVGWMTASSVGYFLGLLIADPRLYGLDLVMPIFFAAMLFPLWRGKRRAAGWAIAGLVALLVQHFIEGYWFIVVGSVAGGIAGALIDPPQEKAA